ncbi:DegT/DnrJ/EryC1/StrS family aminotransferase [Daejeonella lutea]|uniref:dTDP-4-amino-4,6-dideoxygalactose transaminase n=1 Tax=Daejeonella lutea TaxID=572036 RepID=A0A1T5A7D5_9SPHI|nr:DegT/DnrJ/EryC1/StrS family aminotransferase [Daejeonella lutea]SKB30637.1 dTDP-4-amino-4,6-dideoxygalactose transaminase [Daejeonella lutea]
MKNRKTDASRRKFIKQSSIAGMATVLTMGATSSILAGTLNSAGTPAILGGTSAWDKARWIKWPIWIPEADEKGVLDVLRSGVWSRAAKVDEFEREWSKACGVKRTLTVSNGTNALVVALNQLDIKGGDEVLVPPYTFIATVQAILANGAMPVFVDVDPETFQIDPDKIEAKITPRTKAILPVHIMGLPADMIRIMAIAKKHNLLVVEDACQAPLAEINKQGVGTFGNAGCFSFQNSKNIAIGEGGAIISNDDAFMDKCVSYQNLGLPYGSAVGTIATGSIRLGTKVRFTEYQAAIGLAQLKRLEAQTVIRNENAAYLKSKLEKIPGILPYRLYPGVTRAAFHLFPFRYKQEQFQGLSRADFLTALRAEGVPCSSGYAPLNTQEFLKDAFASKNFKKMYPKELLDYTKYMERNQCPKNDQLCSEAVWFTQNLLLGSREDMDSIVYAIDKIHKNAGAIKTSMKK